MSDLIPYVVMAVVIVWGIDRNRRYDSPAAVAKRRSREIQRGLRRSGRR
jgi:hypothetical protein